MKNVAVAFGVLGAVICAFVIWHELKTPDPQIADLGTLVVLTLTLIVLVWYAYDTNSIAQITHQRWAREAVLATNFELLNPDPSAGDSGRSIVRFHNRSSLVVHAIANFNFKVYGKPVTAGDLYDGNADWLIFPYQQLERSFEIESLLKQQASTMALIRSEASEENRTLQLTMALNLRFWDELGAERTLPPRRAYFDFAQRAWIPSLGERADS